MHEALDVGDRDRAPTLWEQPILDSKECRTDTKNKKKILKNIRRSYSYGHGY